ncbi:MAG: EamA family transporter [Synergistaceae bacterium]|nr:EamA family transporter [Synergistaceae bacterium]
MKLKSEEFKGGLLVVTAGMFWGMTGTIQGLAPENATALTIGSARVFGAGLLLFIWTLFRRKRILDGEKWNWTGIIIAAFGLTAYQFAFFSAVRLTGVAIGTMIAIGSAPVLAGVLGRFFFKECLSPRWFISTLLAITGCFLLVTAGNSDFSSVSIPGAILAFAAALSYAMEGAGLRIIGNKDPFKTVSLVCMLSAVMALPWLITGDISWIFELRGMICVIILSVFTTILPLSLFTKGIEKITLGKAYTLSLSEPMTAWLLSTLLLGERLSLIGSAGVLILFSGIVTLACDNSK